MCRARIAAVAERVRARARRRPRADSRPLPNPNEKKTSYAPVDIKEDFASIMARMSAAKDGVMRRQMDLLAQRYDLANRAAPDAKMFRGKAVQDGVRVRPPVGNDLGAARRPWSRTRSAPATRSRPASSPCRTRTIPEGGMIFPQLPHRRGQPPGAARPHALRPRLRHPRALPARVPAPDLPHHAPGPRRRLAGQARHHR